MANNKKILSLRACLILFLFLPIIAICQQNSSIDFVIGSDYTYRMLVGEADLKSLQNERESGNISLRYGIDYNYQLREKVIFKTGIRVAKIGYSRNYNFTNLIFIDIEDGQINTPNQSDEYKVSIKTNHRFIEIPLVVRYLINKKKLSPFLEFGLSPYLYVNTRKKGSINEVIIDSNERIENKDFNKVNLILMISFGLEYNLTKNLKIFFQPNYRQSLLESTKNGNLKEYPYSLGLEFGLRKYLN